jgi:hypothetical protein
MGSHATRGADPVGHGIRARLNEARHAAARRDPATPSGPREGDPPRPPTPRRPDRLPRVVLAIGIVILAAAGVSAVYALGKPTASHDVLRSASAGSTSAGDSTSRTTGPRTAPRYAGLTHERTANLAATDLATLLGSGSSGSAGGVIATSGSRLIRTRCFHSGHWSAYWNVRFAGGSPVFESRRQALVFCNRNPHVIEGTSPIRH